MEVYKGNTGPTEVTLLAWSQQSDRISCTVSHKPGKFLINYIFSPSCGWEAFLQLPKRKEKASLWKNHYKCSLGQKSNEKSGLIFCHQKGSWEPWGGGEHPQTRMILVAPTPVLASSFRVWGAREERARLVLFLGIAVPSNCWSSLKLESCHHYGINVLLEWTHTFFSFRWPILKIGVLCLIIWFCGAEYDFWLKNQR